MSIIVTDKQTLVAVVNQPEHTNIFGRKVGAWQGVLETKRDNYTADQILALAGHPDWIERILRIDGDGITEITDAVLDYAGERV